MSLKRKHVSFTEEPVPTTIHPSRAALIVTPGQPNSKLPPTGEPKKPKVLSEKKKRYLAKKAKRHRTLAKAKRDSAPKNKRRQAEDSVSNTAAGESEQDGRVASAAPSVDAVVPETPALAGPSKILELERADGDGDGQQELVEGGQRATSGDREDIEAARVRRKKEKRAKREKRDRSEKRKRKDKEKANVVEPEPLSGEAGAVGDDDDNPVASGGPTPLQRGDAVDSESPFDPVLLLPPDDRISPPPLEAFPLPTPAPAPDPAILSRQGLPAGLDNATFVDQDLRTPVSEVEYAYYDTVSKGVGEKMEKRLAEIGVKDLFAVQAALLPHLMALPLIPHPYYPLKDYLVSAPTGSGKTLAYAIPLIHILSNRVVKRLRALIVLPTRDLVVQVRETMEILAKGSGLTIGAVTGQHSFSHEQTLLVADRESTLLGGSSRLDILIATPGRLIGHLLKTPNFSLQHLRFLIMDEADRLLNQSFQDWLAQVLSHTRPPTKPLELPEGFERDPGDCIAGGWTGALGLAVGEDSGKFRPICQKLLFSATLTRDPSSIASLHLTSPQYFIVQSSLSATLPAQMGESFALPDTLTERYLALPPALKPLNLIHLLHGVWKVRGGLVFLKSVESVGRLVKLLEFFEDAYAGEDIVVAKGYTSDMKPSERKALLAEFAAGSVDLLVCSDLIARGMDLPSVSHVISYDTPLDMRKYVHRVGRTARAGRSGTAWTLVEKQEALHFKAMIKGAGREKRVKKMKVKEVELEGYKPAYGIAMRKLKDFYGRAD